MISLLCSKVYTRNPTAPNKTQYNLEELNSVDPKSCDPTNDRSMIHLVTVLRSTGSGSKKTFKDFPYSK